MGEGLTISRRTLLAGSAALAATALAAVPTAHADPAASGCWTLVPSASDDFTSFDTSNWNKGLWYATSGVGAFNPANITVTGGELALTAKLETYDGKPYAFGAVESKFDIPGAPSYVEVRAKVLDSAANVLSAIWMQTSPLSQANNPNPEIDIEVDGETVPVRAVEVTGADHDDLYARQAAAYPQFAEYQQKTTRTIPVVALDRR